MCPIFTRLLQWAYSTSSTLWLDLMQNDRTRKVHHIKIQHGFHTREVDGPRHFLADWPVLCQWWRSKNCTPQIIVLRPIMYWWTNVVNPFVPSVPLLRVESPWKKSTTNTYSAPKGAWKLWFTLQWSRCIQTRVSQYTSFLRYCMYSYTTYDPLFTSLYLELIDE